MISSRWGTSAQPAPLVDIASEAADEEDEALDLGNDEDGGDDELLLDSDDILTSPVAPAPIAPPADEDLTGSMESERPRAARESGTLFERMSNIARGAAKAQVEEEDPLGARREPIDIPRFLNRQNNQ